MLHRFLSRFVFAIALLLSLGAGNALAYSNPGSHTGYVNDFAHLISAETKQSLEMQLEAFEASTTNEIAVVTIPSLGDDAIEEYAIKLFEDWKIGKKGIDNGVLLLIALQERKVRIEVGYGLEGALPDSVAQSIINNDISPAFKGGNYGEGIQAGVDAIIRATQGEYTAKDTEDNVPWVPFGVLIFFFGSFILQIFVALFGRSKSWWAGGIVGAIIALGATLFLGFMYIGLLSFVVLVPLGLLFDFIASKLYSSGSRKWWGGPGGWGTGGNGSSGGGFGGFGGGSSGGGGASGGW